jgi:hypothetical protein
LNISRIKIFAVTAVLFILSTNSISAQIFVENHLEENINHLIDFINSDNFSNLKKNNSDLDLIDTLYLRGLKFNNNDYSETLLALTFATLPFHKMPLHIPFTGIILDLKLPSGAEEQLKSKKIILLKTFFTILQNRI